MKERLIELLDVYLGDEKEVAELADRLLELFLYETYEASDIPVENITE